MLGRPKVKMLKREAIKLDFDAEIRKEEKDLANRAYKELGYAGLSATISHEENREEHAARVAAVLKAVGIVPFTSESVIKYKNKMRRKASNNNVTAHWVENGINHFNGRIPAFALQTALRVNEEAEKQGLVAHRLGIDELEVQRQRGVYDPFLFLDYAGQRYYLEVWDEPDFKGERKV